MASPDAFDREFARVVQWAAANRAAVQQALESVFGATALVLERAQQPHDIHTDLDHAVLRAYGWPADLPDEQLLARLLALNLERAAVQAPVAQEPVTDDADDAD